MKTRKLLIGAGWVLAVWALGPGCSDPGESEKPDAAVGDGSGSGDDDLPADGGPDAGSDPGADPGADPGGDPATDAGGDPGSDPGQDAGTDAGSDPGDPGPSGGYLIGTGVYDITGPPAGVAMTGYAKPDQKSAGIHTRLRARAFVFAEEGGLARRVLLVNTDLWAITQGIKMEVVERLDELGLADLYHSENVMLSAQHTHSGPGGYSYYSLYNLMVGGFCPKNFEIIVDGIVQAILLAHDNLAPGVIKYNQGELLDTSINRSLEAFQENPEASQVPHTTNKTMKVIRLERPDGTEIGAVSWFGVHSTSVSNFHQVISADNKGHCQHLFEKDQGTEYHSPETFVAACMNTELGDSSPNILEDINGDEDWDGEGGEDDFLSCAISGQKQYARFKELYDNAGEVVLGPIDFRHQFFDFEQFQLPSGNTTCPASIGVSMLAGAEDGPGVGNEGVTCPSVIFPCPDCSLPKPITLWIGNQTSSGNPRSPIILPVQILRIGNLALLGVPSEWTTVSGMRLKATVRQVLEPAGVDHCVVQTNSNAYAGYVATAEAYQLQHYEGASTHFGPHTLEAYQWAFEQLAMAMRDGQPTPSSVFPPDRTDSEWTWLEPEAEMTDCPLPTVSAIGEVETQPEASYTVGDLVTVSYSGGHPNRDYLIQQSFFTIERNDNGTWTPVAYDWHPETWLHWERVEVDGDADASRMTIEWLTTDAQPGEYRIRFQGYWSETQGTEQHFEGQTQSFTIQP